MKTFLNILFGLMIFSASSRGIIEVYFSKQAGYVIQLFFGLLFSFFMLVLWRKNSEEKILQKSLIFYFLLFISFLSATYMSIFQGFYISWIYVVAMSVFYLLFYIYTGYNFKSVVSFKMDKWIAVNMVVLMLVAILQQRGLLEILPGNTLLNGDIRPSSLTGSYLHYPLIISIGAFLMAETYTTKKRLIYLVLFLLFSLAPIIAYSRSGSMIIILGLIVYFLLFTSFSRKMLLLSIGFPLTILSVLLFSNNIYFQRVISSVDINSAGNTGRIEQWELAIDMFLNSPIIIGGYTGLITNVTNNFSNIPTEVVESGALQQLLNFGLLGFILFYVMFIFCFFKISKKHIWLRSVLLAAVLESLIYQSIEVYPFMLLLAILPLYSSYLLQVNEQI